VGEEDRAIETFRRMSPAQKWEASMRLYWSARALKEAWLRKLHPEWGRERLREELKEFFSHGHR